MQKEINDEIWEKKDIRMARMNSITNATNFLTTCVNIGIFKPKDMDEALVELNGYRNRIFDWIYENMEQSRETQQKQPSYIEKKEYHIKNPNDPITEKQIEVIEGILEQYDDLNLIEGWRESMTKGKASEIISSHPPKFKNK